MFKRGCLRWLGLRFSSGLGYLSPRVLGRCLAGERRGRGGEDRLRVLEALLALGRRAGLQRDELLQN